jgi:hypothetical protein
VKKRQLPQLTSVEKRKFTGDPEDNEFYAAFLNPVGAYSFMVEAAR